MNSALGNKGGDYASRNFLEFSVDGAAPHHRLLRTMSEAKSTLQNCASVSVSGRSVKKHTPYKRSPFADIACFVRGVD